MANAKRNDEDEEVELLAVALRACSEPFNDDMLADLPRDVREAIGRLTDTVAALALDEEPVAPPADLRDRVMESVIRRRR